MQQDLHAAWNHGGDVSQENGNWWSSISANATINCRLYLLLLLLLVAFICDRQHHHQDMVWWANGNCRRIVADNSSCKIWFVGQLLVLVLDILLATFADNSSCKVWFGLATVSFSFRYFKWQIARYGLLCWATVADNASCNQELRCTTGHRIEAPAA